MAYKVSYKVVSEQGEQLKKTAKDMDTYVTQLNQIISKLGNDELLQSVRESLKKFVKQLEEEKTVLNLAGQVLIDVVQAYTGSEKKSVQKVDKAKAHNRDFYKRPVVVASAGSGSGGASASASAVASASASASATVNNVSNTTVNTTIYETNNIYVSDTPVAPEVASVADVVPDVTPVSAVNPDFGIGVGAGAATTTDGLSGVGALTGAAVLAGGGIMAGVAYEDAKKKGKINASGNKAAEKGDK